MYQVSLSSVKKIKKIMKYITNKEEFLENFLITILDLTGYDDKDTFYNTLESFCDTLVCYCSAFSEELIGKILDDNIINLRKYLNENFGPDNIKEYYREFSMEFIEKYNKIFPYTFLIYTQKLSLEYLIKHHTKFFESFNPKQIKRFEQTKKFPNKKIPYEYIKKLIEYHKLIK